MSWPTTLQFHVNEYFRSFFVIFLLFGCGSYTMLMMMDFFLFFFAFAHLLSSIVITVVAAGKSKYLHWKKFCRDKMKFIKHKYNFKAFKI